MARTSVRLAGHGLVCPPSHVWPNSVLGAGRKKESGIESRVSMTHGAVVPVVICVVKLSSHRHRVFHQIIRMFLAWQHGL